MCRLTVYKGKPILIGDLIVRPENSLIVQSRDAGYHPGVDATADVSKRNIRVNGDGFGIAWYRYTLPTCCGSGSCSGSSNSLCTSSSCPVAAAAAAAEQKGSKAQVAQVHGFRCPAVATCFQFKFITPAWSNSNLRSLGNAVSSELIFAHIRAASAGITTGNSNNGSEKDIVNEENCHPFKFKQWIFAHNGGVPCFHQIKRALLALLDDEAFALLSGRCDGCCCSLTCPAQPRLALLCSRLHQLHQLTHSLNRPLNHHTLSFYTI
jgi:predicted glutamine amidotransferase